MPFCANCGTEVGGRFCASCGAATGSEGQAAAAPAPQIQYVPVVVPQKVRHGVPALLSLLVPGLGQFVKGQVGRGLLFFCGTAASVILIAAGIGIVLTPIMWVLGVADAYTAPEA